MDRYSPKDNSSPLPSFTVDMPNVNTSSFLPDLRMNDPYMPKMPDIKLPDFMGGQSGFFGGFSTFGKMLGNSNPGYVGGTMWGNNNRIDYGTYQFPWNKTTTTSQTGSYGYFPNGSGYGLGSATGAESILNQYDSYFQAAGAAYGIDPNWLKAIAMMEEGWTGTSGAGALGIMQIMPGGYAEGEKLYPNYDSDPYHNIMLGAYILAQKVKENGGDLNLGTQRYLGVGTDPYTGITTGQYLTRIQGFYDQLRQSSNTIGTGKSGSVINALKGYLGTPYVWGGIPGRGQTPTGWDCSGLTYWADQNFGNGQLPMGSHYQYQYAQQSGKLFTSMSQLMPGDLIFFDTGNTAGAGAELNRAGHVAVYIGNGQILHASNPQEGTIISSLSDYYTSRFIGAMHMSWSG